MGPDGNLYATRTVPGQIWRFKLDSAGIPIGEEVFEDFPESVNMINGLTFDPYATAENLIFYFSQINGGGKIYRVRVGKWGNAVILEQTLMIDKIGLFGNHATNNLTFGKNGLLYITLSGRSSSGALFETPWSGAIGEVNLSHPAFLKPPVDISSLDVLGDTIYTGDEPIKLFATGLRNAHGILQHSNGSLYATIHDPEDGNWILLDGSQNTGFGTTYIPDLLVRLERGKYYGHTNASRGQFVYFGANPTSGVDPFEVPEIAVGTKSDMDMNLVLGVEHHSCIGGLDEYTDGSLLVSLLKDRSALNGHLEWFDLDTDGNIIRPNPGDVVLKHDYIKGVEGKEIPFGGVMDALVTPQGWVYVADFGYRSGNEGTGDIAGLYLLKPTGQVSIRKPTNHRFPRVISSNSLGVQIKLMETKAVTVECLGINGQDKTMVFSGTLSAGVHFLAYPKTIVHKGVRVLQILENGQVFPSVTVSL